MHEVKKTVYQVLTVLTHVACVLLLTATSEVRAVGERVLVTRAAILTRIAAREADLRCLKNNMIFVKWMIYFHNSRQTAELIHQTVFLVRHRWHKFVHLLTHLSHSVGPCSRWYRHNLWWTNRCLTDMFRRSDKRPCSARKASLESEVPCINCNIILYLTKPVTCTDAKCEGRSHLKLLSRICDQ